MPLPFLLVSDYAHPGWTSSLSTLTIGNKLSRSPRGILFLVHTIVHRHVITIRQSGLLPWATIVQNRRTENAIIYYKNANTAQTTHSLLHMQHPELPFFSFISALLVILPLSCHWPTRNVAVLALMSWLFIANVIYGINSLVWAGNIRNSVPVWCDICQWFFHPMYAQLLRFELCSHEDYRWCLIRTTSLYLVYL